MALVKTDFLFPPPKKKGAREKIVVKNKNKSTLFQIAWNGEKIGRKSFLYFLTPYSNKTKGAREKIRLWK